MSLKATSTQKLSSLEPVFCPHTGKRVVAESYKRFDIPGGRVTWFHCEACQGWHIVIDNVAPDNSLFSSSETNSLPGEE